MRWFPSVLLATVALCGTARADEAAIVQKIENLGGKITRDDKQPGKPVTGIVLPVSKVTDKGLKDLKGLKQLTSLELKNTKVTTAAVKDLQEALPKCTLRNTQR